MMQYYDNVRRTEVTSVDSATLENDKRTHPEKRRSRTCTPAF